MNAATQQVENVHRSPNPNSESDRNFAIRRLEQEIERGRVEGARVLDRVMREVPTDIVVKHTRINFAATADAGGAVGGMRMDVPGSRFTLHQNAMEQVGERLAIPRSYVDDLASTEWGRDLLVDNFNRLIDRRFADDPKKFLVRTVDGQARAFLSDRFRRLDSRPVLESLGTALKEVGAVVVGGFSGDVKVGIKAVLPRVVEPVPGEFMVFGVAWRNSDFGRGAQQVDAFGLRLVCLNGLISAVEMRRVHLGARLDDDIAYSDRTYRLDTATVASAVRDQVKGLLEPARVDALAEQIRASNADRLAAPAAVLNGLRTRLSKRESEAIAGIYNSPDVVNLPPGNTRWRMANAISYFANTDAVAGERALELQAIAGGLTEKAAA